MVDVLLSEIVVVRHLNEHLRGVNKEGVVVAFGLLEHHDTGGDAGAEEQVGGKLDNAVNIVVINQIFADFSFRPAAIHDAGEADDGSGAAGGKPRQAVHDEG